MHSSEKRIEISDQIIQIAPDQVNLSASEYLDSSLSEDPSHILEHQIVSNILSRDVETYKVDPDYF